MQVKYLLNVKFRDYLIQFFICDYEQASQKACFSWKMFVSLALALASYCLSFLHRKLAIQICFGKVAGENGKKLLPETSLSYQKRITPMGVFNFSTLYVSTANDSWVRIKVGKQHYYKKGKQIGYLTIFNIINILTFLSTDGQSALLLRVPSLPKIEVRNFSLLYFPRWFCVVYGQLAMSPRRVKKSVICKFQCFYLFDIQQWSVLS